MNIYRDSVLNKKPDKIKVALHKLHYNEKCFHGCYIHKIQMTVQTSDEEIFISQPYLLNSVLRLLMNSNKTINGISNRKWFSENFVGGLYKITVDQQEPESFPLFMYNCLLFSRHSDLKTIEE